jgi:predicted Zn-dependent protease
MELMSARGINPNGMIELLEILSKQSTIQPPAFLSTHPVFEERIPEAKSISKGLNQFWKTKFTFNSFEELKTLSQ